MFLKPLKLQMPIAQLNVVCESRLTDLKREENKRKCEGTVYVALIIPALQPYHLFCIIRQVTQTSRIPQFELAKCQRTGRKNTKVYFCRNNAMTHFQQYILYCQALIRQAKYFCVISAIKYESSNIQTERLAFVKVGLQE